MACGLSPKMVERRVGSGHLHRVHRGVYAVGHGALTAAGRRHAAVLAGGPGAVLSHRSAAAVWGLRADNRRVEDITCTTRRARRAGLVFHQARLEPTEVATRDGLSVSSVPRTLLDLASHIPHRDLVRALEHADRLELFDSSSLDAQIHRARGHHGSGALRRALAAYDPRHHRTRSELERRALELLDRHRIARPELNVRIGTSEVDMLWREARLVLELDGYETHRTRAAFERDRARDRALAAAGLRVVRVTWRQLVGDEDRLAADLRALVGSPP